MKTKLGHDQPYRGHLGRTAQTSVLISSAQGTVFPASVYTCVNITQTPELREALLNETLNHVQCPFSDHVYKLAIPIIYHDEDRFLFVLVLPDELRHEEFKHRSALLEALSKEREILPAYVHAFQTVFNAASLEHLETPEIFDTPQPVQPPLVDESARLQLEQEQLRLEKEQQQLEHEKIAIQSAQRELENARIQLQNAQNELENARLNFNATSQSLDADRAALNEMRAQLDREHYDLQLVRDELNEQRRVLFVDSLNLEQARLSALAQNSSEPDEHTQVVTDDQFVEVMGYLPGEHVAADDDDLDFGKEIVEIDADSEVYEIEEIFDSASDNGSVEATRIIESPLNAASLSFHNVALDHVPNFENAFSSDNNLDYGITLHDNRLLAGWLLLEEQIEPYRNALDEKSLRFYFQYRELNDYPLIALMLACVDTNEQALETIAMPIDCTDSAGQKFLTQLANDENLRIALYNSGGEARLVFDIRAPIASNIAWARERAEQLLQQKPAAANAFNKTVDTFLADDFQRLGTMRHTFEKDSFSHAARPSQAKLAAGVVGYWSLDDVFDYLIGVRSFPLRDFRAIQLRAIDQAVEWGIFINDSLQKLAISEAIAPDLRTLTELIIANFAEVCVGIRTNDLDPIQQWENWDSLLGLAADVAISLDPSVLELAEISLKRAQEYQDMLEVGNSLNESYDDFDDENDEDQILAGDEFQEMLDAVHFDDLVVARHSEQTGITYFLPESALIDSFDDMANMSQIDLEIMLEDGSGRLEAAQMLIERFGKTALPAVLTAADTMNATEVAALSRFAESRAEELVPELITALNACGPSALYIASRALVAQREAPGVNDAIPTLLNALVDPDREANQPQLVQTLAQFGDSLVQPLIRAIKQNAGDKSLIALLGHLEQERPGTLAEFARDRSKPLRDAAASARTRLETLQN